MQCHSLSVVVLKSILFNRSIATSVFYWFLFEWKMFFHPFTFSLYIFLHPKQVSCRQHIDGCYIFIHSATPCLLIVELSTFTFKVTIDKYVLIPILIVFVCFVVPLFLYFHAFFLCNLMIFFSSMLTFLSFCISTIGLFFTLRLMYNNITVYLKLITSLIPFRSSTFLLFPPFYISLLMCACMCAKWLESCLTLCDPVDSSVHARFLCPWDSSVKNTGLGCHALFQGIFPTQGSNHVSYVSCIGRQVLYH